MTIKPTIDFNDPAFHANPYPFYHELRAVEPVQWVAMAPPAGGAWFCTRYEDVAALLKEARLSKERARLVPEENVEPIFRSMLFTDPPNHTRLRSLVGKAFTPKRVEALRGRIQTIADELIDAMRTQSKIDFITAFAAPLPIIVIAELLGVPVADRDRFQAWSRAAIIAGDGARNTTATQVASDLALWALDQYLSELITTRRRQPENDLISAMIAARDAEARLTEVELLQICRLLLIAGYETTINLLGNGMLALLEHPDQFKLLKENPLLVESAVEEMLRFDSPVQRSTFRICAQDFMIGNKQITKNQVVSLAIGAANRDPEVFTNPDNFDITRRPNPHVAFGLGIHFCLGAPLARLEGEVAFNTLLERLPNLQLSNEAPEWSSNTIIRGLRSLVVAV